MPIERIQTFDQFIKQAKSLAEEEDEALNIETPDKSESEPAGAGKSMFFQNLISMKHHIDEILAMNPDEVNELINADNGWALDHIATSKDDIQEVADYIRSEIYIETSAETEADAENIPIDNIEEEPILQIEEPKSEEDDGKEENTGEIPPVDNEEPINSDDDKKEDDENEG